MTSIRFFKLHGCMKYPLHSNSILHSWSGCKFTRIFAHMSVNMAYHTTIICRNRTNLYSQQSLHRTSGTVLVAPKHYHEVCKYQHLHISPPCVQLFAYCSTYSETDLEQTEDMQNEELKDIDDDEMQEEEENSHDSYHGDIDNFHIELDAEWEEELKEIKEMLQCSDEKLVKLVTHYPRLKDKELLKQVKSNVKILLDHGIRKSKIVSKLLSSQGVFLQISPTELSEFFQKHEYKWKQGKTCEIYTGWYADLRCYLLTRLKSCPEEDNVNFLASLLKVKYEVIVNLNRHKQLEMINNTMKAYLLKEKVDFILWEGLSPEDIAYNADLLSMSLKYLGTSITEMKATVKEISIPMLRSIYNKQIGLRDLPSMSKVPLTLDCSAKDFSKLQRIFLNSANHTDAINVALYLIDKGIHKQEIRSNPYVLGHKLECVKDRFENKFKTWDIGTPDAQTKLLNMLVYDLEYENSAE